MSLDSCKLDSMSMLDKKREQGRYYTEGNPFNNEPFLRWASQAGLPERCILEPFAGSNSLIKMLADLALCRQFTSYDITPADAAVKHRDTLESFPQHYDVCVTNPPWLAKNSAAVRGLPFPKCEYDDLYKFALKKCLDNCAYIAALIPESFIAARLFQDRLHTFISLTAKMFSDTNHPVGLALFVPEVENDVEIYCDHKRVGSLSKLQELKPRPQRDGVAVRFNDPEGNVGLIALDNTREASIRFCDVEELAGYVVKASGRHITKLHVGGEIRIEDWNRTLAEFRDNTQDVLMTCYKGIRKDGKYRRRCDWSLARGIIHQAYTTNAI